MSFNKWLLEKRKAAGLTQGDLAKRASISTSYVSTLERSQPHTVTGAQPQPAIDVVESIAKALQVDVNEARLAAGYAAKNASSGKPRNLKEAAAALEDLGIIDLQMFGGDEMFENFTEDDFEEFVEKTRAEFGFIVKRSAKRAKT